MQERTRRPTGERMNFVELRKTALDHPVWIDLGCGANKQPGFVGIDRFALSGVDIVADLDRGIPLPSGVADYVLASHSLEHLRDLPAAIAEINRVCKDRAVVTIIAPYDATRLNQANPYHRNVWNEHTARFFTSAAETSLDREEFDFPSIGEWGLSASDYSPPDIDLRCLRMEFTYFPPYRGLDERAKRTLRRSLSDVCDQMALHLLVVKSPITREELAARAASIQYPVTPAFDARRRDEAAASGQNLFSELARTPARIDRLDRALVAETEETRRTLGERITAVNSALTRRMQAMADEVRADTAAELRAAAAQRVAQASAGEQVLYHLVAERRARADQAFRPLRLLRRYHQRGTDLRTGMGGDMVRLWQGAEAPNFRLQAGAFLKAAVARSYRVTATGSLHGIEIGVLAMFPPTEPSPIADFEIVDDADTVLRAGSVTIDASCAAVPVTIGFQPLGCEPGSPLTLKLMPRPLVDRVGVQLLEWHRVTRVLRRVREMRLAWRGRYS
jgi:hypothetical protein